MRTVATWLVPFQLFLLKNPGNRLLRLCFAPRSHSWCRVVGTALVLLGLGIGTPAWAQTEIAKAAAAPLPARKAKEAKTEKEPTAAERNENRESSEWLPEINALREQLETQRRELELQRAALQEQQQKIAALEGQLKAPNALPRDLGAAVGNPGNGAKGAGPASNAASTARTISAEPQQERKAEESPAAIRYKGITITPGGFLAAEAAWRQRALSADVNTPFNSVPFPGSSQSRITEFNPSGRQSRVSLLGEGRLQSVKLTGYYETDFLSAGVTSNNNQSNSYTLRQRQVWGQAALDSGWSFTGGQMWSLVTETRKGVQNRTEATPLTIDAQYTSGFSWARQFGFRVSKSFQDKVWLAFSVEGPQTTLTAHGFSNNSLLGAAGAGGGLFNATANYSFNATPDFVLKAAFEPGWGHYEVFGVISVYRSRIFPCATASTTSPCPVDGSTIASAAGASNDRRAGGGIGVNARVPVLNKKLDVGLHFLGGDGINRYGTTGLADATARPDGTLALLRGGQALGTLEWHATPDLDIYANVGGEYAARAAYLNAAGKPVGYGSPLFNNSGCSTEPLPGSNQFTPGSLSNCTGDTRNIIEGTLGFWFRFYKGPRGMVQWGPQYSYVVRNTWTGTGGAPRGIENMIFTSFRYYLP